MAHLLFAGWRGARRAAGRVVGRRACRFGLPVLLLLQGWMLLRLAMPGTEVVIPGPPLQGRMVLSNMAHVSPGVWPSGVLADRQGTLYFGDGPGHCVWRLSPRGELARVHLGPPGEDCEGERVVP